jgi:hypothetical protein
MAASGYFALMALAIDTAGKMCPPVPPPLMMTLNSLFIVVSISLVCKNTLFFSQSLIFRHFFLDKKCYIYEAKATAPIAGPSAGIGFRFAERLMLRMTPT